MRGTRQNKMAGKWDFIKAIAVEATQQITTTTIESLKTGLQSGIKSGIASLTVPSAAMPLSNNITTAAQTPKPITQSVTVLPGSNSFFDANQIPIYIGIGLIGLVVLVFGIITVSK